MKLLELYGSLKREVEQHVGKEYQLDQEMRIAIASPSIGPRASIGVRSISFGFDWDSGTVFIHPEKPLVVKSQKQEVWDLAFDHIYSLSLQVSPKGNPTSAAKWAKQVLDRAKELEK